MRSGLTELDPARFRAALGQFGTGVTVVTGHSGAEPVGFACQSFAALSLDPPLVLFCPATASRTWPVIERTGRFAVNVLAEAQRDICARFGARGADKFADLEWTSAPSGAPVLAGVLSWVDCTVEAVHDAGDHYVVVGRVAALGEPGGGQPLLFYRGRYCRAVPLDATVHSLAPWAGPDDWF